MRPVAPVATVRKEAPRSSRMRAQPTAVNGCHARARRALACEARTDRLPASARVAREARAASRRSRVDEAARTSAPTSKSPAARSPVRARPSSSPAPARRAPRSSLRPRRRQARASPHARRRRASPRGREHDRQAVGGQHGADLRPARRRSRRPRAGAGRDRPTCRATFVPCTWSSQSGSAGERERGAQRGAGSRRRAPARSPTWPPRLSVVVRGGAHAAAARAAQARTHCGAGQSGTSHPVGSTSTRTRRFIRRPRRAPALRAARAGRQAAAPRRSSASPAHRMRECEPARVQRLAREAAQRAAAPGRRAARERGGVRRTRGSPTSG